MSSWRTSACSNRSSILVLPGLPLGGGPQERRLKLDRGIGVFLGLLNYLTLVTLPCAEELTLYGACAELLAHWYPLGLSSGARGWDLAWAPRPHLHLMDLPSPPRRFLRGMYLLKCYMVPSHMCLSKWHTMHIWSLPHIHLWISERLVWMDCDRHLWRT